MWPAICALVLFALVQVACAMEISGTRLSRRPALSLQLHPRQFVNGSAATNASGITPATLSSDKQSYYSVIQAGNISFRVALDTASSDLWLMSTGCSTSTCKAVPRYPLPYYSGTFVSVNGNNTAFSVGFADGTAASGFVGRETIQLSNLTIANQAFGVVTTANVTMDDEVTGILGLGFPRLSTIANSVTSAAPFFANLAQQGQLDYPLFGLSLTRNSSGTLSIGAIDSSVVTNSSNIGWNEVVPFSPFGSESNTSSYFQWAIRLSSFAVNGTSITPQPTYPDVNGNASLALLDIGTSGMYGPFQDVSRLFSMIDGSRLVDPSGQWALPCDISETMSFNFDNQNVTLQPSDFLIGPAAGNPNMCLSWPRALPPSSDGIDWQLGSAFLRAVYSIFSYGINAKEPPMIGLYPRHNATAPVEPAGAVSSFLSSASATIATTLPNFPISTPSYTTPPYAFNTSVSGTVGQIVSSDLATSTYSAVLGPPRADINDSALPTVSPAPTLVTFIVTNAAGMVETSTSTVAMPSITLGLPGYNAAAALSVPLYPVAVSWLISLIVFATRLIL